MAQTQQSNLDIITAAYRLDSVIDEVTQPSWEQSSVGLQVLNDMLMNYEVVGVRVGWYPQTSLNATAPIQDYNVMPVKILLAYQLCLHYGIPISPDLKAEADEQFDVLAKRSIEYFDTDLTGIPWAQGGLFGPGRI